MVNEKVRTCWLGARLQDQNRRGRHPLGFQLQTMRKTQHPWCPLGFLQKNARQLLDLQKHRIDQKRQKMILTIYVCIVN